jgi:hypothetical protein
MSSRQRQLVGEPADLSGLALHDGTQEQLPCQCIGAEFRAGKRSCPRTVRGPRTKADSCPPTEARSPRPWCLTGGSYLTATRV